MRKKGLQKVVSTVLASTMLLSMAAGCQSTDAGTVESNEKSATGDVAATATVQTNETKVEAVETMEDTTIHIRVMNEFRNLDKVLAKYDEMTKDDPIMSHIHPDFTFVAGGDYKDKLSMALAAQEDYDLMFCGGWHGLSTFTQQGNFADLSGYFNNDAFPGLKKAFSPDLVEAMTSYIQNDDGNYTKGVYSINLASYFEDSRGFMYREDLRKKYGCDPITDEASLFTFVQTVAENEADMEGASIYNFFRLDSPWYSAKHDHVFTQDNVNILGDQTWVYVGLSDDNTQVLNVVFPGDSDEEFAKMPANYQYDFIDEYLLERTKWNPYMNPSRGSTDVVEKNAAIAYCTLTEYESKVKDATDKIPGSEYGFYVIEDAQRNKEEGAVICDMVTNNWLVVPEWSEKTDAVMYFLDWMFGNQDAHDLFQYGIEGEDWEAIGEDGYKALDIDEESKYFMPTYSFTLNPTYIRDSEFVLNNPDIKADFEYIYDNNTYQLSPLAGFSFKATDVETELANVTALSNELQLTLSMYSADEVVSVVDNWNSEATKVGLEKIRQELIDQIQKFLDVKNGK